MNKSIAEEYLNTDVSGFLDADIIQVRDNTYQDYLFAVSRIINFEIRLPASGNISSTKRREPSSSNSDHNFEVIDTSNPNLERLEDGSYGRRSRFICTLNYVCILFLM